jgi:D-alanine-D-alanine ligase
MQRYRIGVLMGGSSSEVEISLQSGQAVFEHLDRVLFEPYRVHLLPSGWTVLDDEGHAHPIDRNDFSFERLGQKFHFDALFNAIHGKPGEDGTLQGYLDLLNLPYTGCSTLEMALTFDKAACNIQAAALGIRTSPSVHTPALADPAAVRRACDQKGLRLPVFVKPTRSGSSFGVSKVDRWDDLAAALVAAGAENSHALVEQGVLGTEVGCGVARLNGVATVLEITEIVSENAFFDYEAKYQGASQEITPARLPKATSDTPLLRLPISARAIGEVKAMRASFTFALSTPTMVKVNSVPARRPTRCWKVTVAPNRTADGSDTGFHHPAVTIRSFSSARRPSSSPCAWRR